MCCCRFAICVKEGIAYGEKFILKRTKWELKIRIVIFTALCNKSVFQFYTFSAKPDVVVVAVAGLLYVVYVCMLISLLKNLTLFILKGKTNCKGL